jgi:hypothetical protein
MLALCVRTLPANMFQARHMLLRYVRLRLPLHFVALVAAWGCNLTITNVMRFRTANCCQAARLCLSGRIKGNKLVS